MLLFPTRDVFAVQTTENLLPDIGETRMFEATQLNRFTRWSTQAKLVPDHLVSSVGLHV